MYAENRVIEIIAVITHSGLNPGFILTLQAQLTLTRDFLPILEVS
jgi:hypothetical protein